MFFTMAFTGCMFGRRMSSTVRSAFLPGASSSQSARPIASAPPRVAISNTVSAAIADAS